VTNPVAKLGSANKPAPHSFDTRTLLGLSAATASNVARRHGCLWRVVRRNGHGVPMTLDARTNRVNVSVDHGVVVATGVW